jgi:hypothetical protein
MNLDKKYLENTCADIAIDVSDCESETNRLMSGQHRAIPHAYRRLIRYLERIRQIR